jgi:multiple sugar transport system ATP-binding protein
MQRTALKNYLMAQVVIENLSKHFKGPKGADIQAVNHASLSVADGEFLVLVGPSGCGKSTTLRMIAGLEEISSGTVSIDGQVVNDVPPKHRDIAMVFQNYALYPHMTVRENLAFGLKLRKYSREEIEERVGQAADILGLRECLDRRPAALSGGQRQRVAVGRAIVRKPKVFLFDEPLSNLDAQMRVQMRREISALHTRLGATMIYVTHDQVEAMTMGDRIVVMREGVIQQVAEPMELYHRPANMFVAGFIGSPAMNFFRGTVVKREDGIFFQEDILSAESPKEKLVDGFKLRVGDAMSSRLTDYVGKKIVLGIRPENITDGLLTNDAKRDCVVKAVAEVIEPLGAETYLYATTGGHSLVGRLQAGHRVIVKQSVSLTFDMSHAHFFDPVTEKVLS